MQGGSPRDVGVQPDICVRPGRPRPAHPAHVAHPARVAGAPRTARVTHAAANPHETRLGGAAQTAGAAHRADVAGAALDAHPYRDAGAPHAAAPLSAFVRVGRTPGPLHYVKLPPHLGEHGGGAGGVVVVLVHRQHARGHPQFGLHLAYLAVALGQPGGRVGPQRPDVPVPARQRPGHYVAGRPRPGQLAAQQRRLALARPAPGRRLRPVTWCGVLLPPFGGYA